MEIYYNTDWGTMILGDCMEQMKAMEDSSVNLIMTSPPYALIKKKEYGNEDSGAYLDWFRPFAREFHRILAENGSFVLNIGGTWNKGEPTRSLYHFKILIMLCEEFGFYLAQEFYFWNPSKLPNPAEWCTVRKIRVKDSVEPVWWLSKNPYPKASNQRVLQPYSKSMQSLLTSGYKAKLRPSGHNISENFMTPHKGSIPPNLLALPNTESNSAYMNYCLKHSLNPHPARFPSVLPEYFIRMCTDTGDIVMDPFAGSCVTGEVAERLHRRWICCETVEEYLRGAVGRFREKESGHMESSEIAYSVFRPGYLWNQIPSGTLDASGGKSRVQRQKNEKL